MPPRQHKARLSKRLLANRGVPYIYAKSFVGGLTSSADFKDVAKYCMFIGHPRSGHSLVGSLLDAHPDAVIAHELDALRYVRAGFTRSQLLWMILDRSRRFTESGRDWTGYNYEVEGQWQGRFRTLKVIGDKKGGVSAMRLTARPELLQQLADRVRLPIKLVRVLRNPFDNIATISRKDRMSVDDAIDFYFDLHDTNNRVRDDDPERVHTFRHEDLLKDPHAKITGMCHFVDLEPETDYLDACANLLFDSPNRARDKVEWSPAQRSRVEAEIAKRPLLREYTFDD